jgi:hypothetical protein
MAGSKYASGKYSIADCDRCGQRYKLSQLRKLTIKTKQVSIKVCPECWETDHPQLQLGMYPVYDPQAIMDPRPDTSYFQSCDTDLGYPSGGSRVYQWGWNPVGGASGVSSDLTPNNLVLAVQIGTVTVVTT